MLSVVDFFFKISKGYANLGWKGWGILITTCLRGKEMEIKIF